MQNALARDKSKDPLAASGESCAQAGHATPLREVWLTEHTRRSEPGLDGRMRQRFSRGIQAVVK
jgi:hypothetical protein